MHSSKVSADWLIVERMENWKVDASNKFAYFGITDAKKKLANEIRAGDRIFVYVAGVRCFADVRCARKDGIRPLRMGGDYLDSYPWCLDTSPLFTLPPEKWLPVKEVVNKVSFLNGLKDWRQSFRTSLRALDKSDANILDAQLRTRAS
jgi:hypothetical protein